MKQHLVALDDRIEDSPLQPFDESYRQNDGPDRLDVQLLRSSSQPVQEVANTVESPADLIGHGVRRGQAEDLAAARGHHPPDGMQQQRPRSDRLHMLVGARQTGEDIPPVVDQRDQSCNDAAAFEITSDEPRPSPIQPCFQTSSDAPFITFIA
jgi:hypothetical protein